MREFLYKAKWHHHHPAAFAKFDELLRNERLSLDELTARQEIARQEIVRAAMTQTRFYRERYGAVGFEVGDIGKDGWFERLPVVTKKDLRERFDDFVNPASRPFLRISTTGGSTGSPTKTGYDGRSPEEVYSWRLQRWFDIHPWDDHAYIWRDTRTSQIAQLKNALLWWPTRHVKLNASFIDDEAIIAFLKRYRRCQPTLLQGYVGAVVQVAQHVLESKVDVANPRLKCVWTTSAPISMVQRKLIERAFGAKVCDQYGSCEIRWIAQQCAEGSGLHVNVEHVHVEFVDEDIRPVETGTYGKTLLTDLENTAFPLIRYENGDRGRWLGAACGCGRTLPCIDSVKGREVESFVLPSGKTVNGEFLTTIFDSASDAALNFKVTQRRDLSIEVEYVPGAVELPQSVVRNFEKSVGAEVPVSFRKVGFIAHDRGKARYVVRER